MSTWSSAYRQSVLSWNNRVTNISKSLTYKMATTKTNWHRYGTKLRHCHPMYSPPPEISVWEFDHINLDL